MPLTAWVQSARCYYTLHISDPDQIQIILRFILTPKKTSKRVSQKSGTKLHSDRRISTNIFLDTILNIQSTHDLVSKSSVSFISQTYKILYTLNFNPYNKIVKKKTSCSQIQLFYIIPINKSYFSSPTRFMIFNKASLECKLLFCDAMLQALCLPCQQKLAQSHNLPGTFHILH